MILQVPDPVEVEVEPPNARRNPISKFTGRKVSVRRTPQRQWQYTCPVCGFQGRRRVSKSYNLKKGRSGPMQWVVSSPLLTRKQAKDALVSHMKTTHKASPVGVRLR